MAKALCYFMIAILFIIMLGQIIAHGFNVKQFNRVDGKILKISVEVTSYTLGSRFLAGGPINSYVLRLQSGQTYNVDYNSSWDGIIKVGKHVTIYMPTTSYNILSLDILDYGTRAYQVEMDGFVLLNFEENRPALWKPITYCIAGMMVFIYLLYQLRNNED
jgi:hypothetical protein